MHAFENSYNRVQFGVCPPPADTRQATPAVWPRLLMEDNRDLCEMLAMLLEREGITLDTLPRPFNPREVVAHVHAVLRRVEQHPSVVEPRLLAGDAVIDFTARSFAIGNVQVQLSAIEFKLLAALARQPGVPLSREALTRAAQLGTYAPLERAVDVQIARLRKRLRHAAPQFEWVRTVRGEGYLFAPPEEDRNG